MAGVLVLAAFAERLDPSTLRGDALAAIADLANWRFLVVGRSYADLFQAPSPLLHFWSLAIEEQFHLVFPVTVWLITRSSRGTRQARRRLRRTLLGGIGLSVVATLVAAPTFVYYSTPTRAAELLVGAVLALGLAPRTDRPPLGGPWPSILGLGALGGIAWLVATTTVTTAWVSEGGLVLFALLSAALIVAALGRGPVSAALGCAPLRWLGRISYGLYLYSWPIVLWLTPTRVGWHGTALIVLQAAATLAAALVSYHVLEMPIRRGRIRSGRPSRLVASSAVAAAAAATILVTGALPVPASANLASAQAALNRRTQQVSRLPASATTGVKVAFYGDSTALATGFGLATWSGAHGNPIVSVKGNVGLGCGIMRGGLVRYEGKVLAARDGCGDWAQTWPAAIMATRPDVAVILAGPFDVADRLLPGTNQWRNPGDPTYDRDLRSEMLQAAQIFLSRHITTIWLTSPEFDNRVDLSPGATAPESDPARTQTFNTIVRSVAAASPGLEIIDLARWVQRWPGGPFDPALRPDGVHFSTVSAADDVAPWLAPQILLAAGVQPPGPPPDAGGHGAH